MRKTILIVDDNKINREVLKQTLRNDYDVLEAENGKVALDLLALHHEQVAVIVLDIVMPVMDGYETLRHIREDTMLAQIPVIINTGSEDEASRAKAISLGASDFLVKPYNPEIILHCLKNNIAHREVSEQVNIVQRDRLTGLYNRDAFFDRVGELVAAHEAGYYVLASFDINGFKVINDQYGTQIGDQVLQHIARTVGACIVAIDGILGRISADNFAMLYPAEYIDSDTILHAHKDAMNPPCLGHSITIRIGRYVVDDLSLSPSAMYDRAELAEDSIKGRFDQTIVYYNESLRNSLPTSFRPRWSALCSSTMSNGSVALRSTSRMSFPYWNRTKADP